MTLETLLEICQSFRDLGDAVGEQIASVVEDDSIDNVQEQSGAALAQAERSFLATIERLANDDDELMEELKTLCDAIQDGRDACPGCKSLPGGGSTPDCPECGQDPDEGDDEIRDDARVSA